MRSFKDANGLTWDIAVNVNVIERVKTLLDVDITELYSEAGSRVFSRPVLLVNVLYVTCKPQADSRGISDIKFGESMIGDAIEDGAKALMESVADFFPSKRRAVMNAAMTKLYEADAIGLQMVLDKISELTPEQLLKPQKSLPASAA